MKIESIRGRRDDYLVMSDGSFTSAVNLYTYFAYFSGIKKFQLIQECIGELIIMVEFYGVITDENWEELTGQIINDLKSKTNLLIKCPRETHFTQSGQGKFSAFIQRVKMLVDLHNHSFLSHDGFSKEREIINACKIKNINAIAITEHDEVCKLNSENFKKNE